ncbi:hypothetical protein [Acidocella sp.]|uniref:hypothetical protein n=1 Tax=Acidocella sp. TaxID=50710 RepID=UPI0017DA80D8|nr:hypothetical protein [Acidocella sp.]NNM55853.1 hypothetical protein [Acidocella sp.]
MTEEQTTELEKAVADAVKAQRESADPHFVYITRESRNLPGLQAALADEARASGRLLVHQTAAMPSSQQTLERAANRQFLKNLDAIARGDV